MQFNHDHTLDSSFISYYIISNIVLPADFTCLGELPTWEITVEISTCNFDENDTSGIKYLTIFEVVQNVHNSKTVEIKVIDNKASPLF